MFQNAYQSGSYLEIFHAKTDKEKDKNYDKLYKITNPGGVSKVYDKITKGYIYELDRGVRTSIQFPFSEKQDLGLIQPFLVFQILLPQGSSFSIEVSITDTAKNKRRLHFISGISKIEKNYFHAKIPIDVIKRGVWLNFSIDLVSFFELFKGQTFRSIDSFSIGASCKIRRIYTMRHPLYDHYVEPGDNLQTEGRMIPKTQNFPQGVSYVNQLITLDTIKAYCSSINETNYADETTLADLTTVVSTSVLHPRGVLTPSNRIPISHRKNVSHIPVVKPKVAFSAQNDNKRLLRIPDKSMIEYKFKDKENIKQNIPKTAEKKTPRPIAKTKARREENKSLYVDKSSYIDRSRHEEKENCYNWRNNNPSPYNKYEYTESFTSTFQRDFDGTLPSVKGFNLEQTTTTPPKLTTPQTTRESQKHSMEFVNLTKLIENHRRKNPEVIFDQNKQDLRSLGKRACTSIKKVKEPLPSANDYAWAETCEFIRLEDAISSTERKPKIQLQGSIEKEPQYLVDLTTPQQNQRHFFGNSEQKDNNSNLKSQPSNTKKNLENAWDNTFGSPQQDFKNLTWRSFKTDDIKVCYSASKDEVKPEIKNPFITTEDKFVGKLGWPFEGEKIKEEEESKSEDNAPYDLDNSNLKSEDQRRELEESSITKVSFLPSPEKSEKSLEIREDFSKEKKSKSPLDDFSRELFEETEIAVKDDLFTNTEKSTGTRWFTAKTGNVLNEHSSTKKKEDPFVESQSKLFESEFDTMKIREYQNYQNHQNGEEIRLEDTAQRKNSLILKDDSESEEGNLEDSLDKLVSEYVDLFENGGNNKTGLQNSRRDKSFSPPWKQTLIVGDAEAEEDKWLSKWIDNIDKSKIINEKDEEENNYENENANHNHNHPFEASECSHEIEVVFDPVWNCYYNPKTNEYYEMKK